MERLIRVMTGVFKEIQQLPPEKKRVLLESVPPAKPKILEIYRKTMPNLLGEVLARSEVARKGEVSAEALKKVFGASAGGMLQSLKENGILVEHETLLHPNSVQLIRLNDRNEVVSLDESGLQILGGEKNGPAARLFEAFHGRKPPFSKPLFDDELEQAQADEMLRKFRKERGVPEPAGHEVGPEVVVRLHFIWPGSETGVFEPDGVIGSPRLAEALRKVKLEKGF